MSVFRLISGRCVFTDFLGLLSVLGAKMRAKTTQSEEKDASREQSGHFPKSMVLYWFLQYILEVRMYEISGKTAKFHFFLLKNVARKKGVKFTGIFYFY